MDENLFLVFVWSPILPMDLKVNVTEIVVVVISLYSSSVQDRHYKSWSAICQVRRKIWKPVWQKSCDTKYASSLPLKGMCHWLWTSAFILVFQLWTFQWNSWYDASEWKVCGDTTNTQTYSWTVCLRFKISKWVPRAFFAIFCSFFPKMKVMIYLRTSW